MIVNWSVPSFSDASAAVQVTVVVPTGNVDPELTTNPPPVLHVIVVGSITPWKESTADGIGGDQVTAAVAKPGSTFLARMLLGAVTTGASISEEKTPIK